MEIKPNTVSLVVQSARPYVDSGLIDKNEFKVLVRRLKSSRNDVGETERKLVSRKEAARLLSVSTKTIDRLLADNLLDRVKIGKATRVRYDEVLNLMG